MHARKLMRVLADSARFCCLIVCPHTSPTYILYITIFSRGRDLSGSSIIRVSRASKASRISRVSRFDIVSRVSGISRVGRKFIELEG